MSYTADPRPSILVPSRNTGASHHVQPSRVTWSEEDEAFVGLCAEFPSLSWLDETPEEALGGIRSVVRSSIEEMAAGGETVPVPLAIRRYSGRFVVRVPPEVHRQLAIEAAESGVSLNRIASAKLAH